MNYKTTFKILVIVYLIVFVCGTAYVFHQAQKEIEALDRQVNTLQLEKSNLQQEFRTLQRQNRFLESQNDMFTEREKERVNE